MFDYTGIFEAFCEKNGLSLRLSFDMPEGFETANGTFIPEVGTVFINAQTLRDRPDCEKAFYLFHELRHAVQHLFPERFSPAVGKGRDYVIQYDGVCYKRAGGAWKACRLEGTQAYFTRLYLGQPHEMDANAFAFAQAKALLGDSECLRRLYAFWTPEKAPKDAEYERIYALIDKKTVE